MDVGSRNCNSTKRERIIKALATYSIVAWRLLWLTYEARKNPQQPTTKILTEAEWQALYCVTHKKKLTSIAQLPKQPPSLRECVRWIAQLGGFLGRKSDGEPGVKTLWRGLQRLEDITCGWLLSQKVLSQIVHLCESGSEEIKPEENAVEMLSNLKKYVIKAQSPEI